MSASTDASLQRRRQSQTLKSFKTWNHANEPSKTSARPRTSPPRSENLGNRERCPTSGSSVPFGIDDAFTTTDGEYHRAFRRRVELLLKINDERWTHLARRATELAPVGVANLYPRPRSCRDISRSLGTEDGAQIQHVHPALRPRGLARLTTTTTSSS